MPSIVFETGAKFLKRLAPYVQFVLHWLESLSLVDEAPCGSGKCSDLCHAGTEASTPGVIINGCGDSGS